jgi:hypothetical protein
MHVVTRRDRSQKIAHAWDLRTYIHCSNTAHKHSASRALLATALPSISTRSLPPCLLQSLSMKHWVQFSSESWCRPCAPPVSASVFTSDLCPSSIYGITCLQVYIYFIDYAASDPRLLSIFVGTLWYGVPDVCCSLSQFILLEGSGLHPSGIRNPLHLLLCCLQLR